MKRIISLILIVVGLLYSPTTMATSETIGAFAHQKEVIVYVTKTGSKYHTSDCRYLSKSKIETTLKSAKSRGYTAYSVCNP